MIRWFDSISGVAAWALVPFLAAPAPADDSLVGTADDPQHSVVELPLVLDVPGAADVEVRKNVPYKSVDGTDLFYDIYLPPGFEPSAELRPVVVFVNGVGDRGTRRLKEWPVYVHWQRAAAASGLPAVMFDARFGREVTQEDMADFFDAFRADAPSHGLDPDRVSLWACSSNVSFAYAYAMAPGREWVRSFALYYGSTWDAENDPIRADLPVQVILAGRDQERLNTSLRTLVLRAVEAGAPWHFVSYTEGRHAFDVLDDTTESRYLIAQTFEFFRTYGTDPVGEPTHSPNLAKSALRPYFAHEWPEARDAYRRYVDTYASDGRAWGRLGQANFSLENWSEAADAYARSAELDWARTTNHYNAACAYALGGSPDEALAQLTASFAAGYTDNEYPRHDQDLALLHTTPAFRELLDAHTTRPATRVAGEDEPGEAMIVRGVVTAADGTPVAGAVVYVHQTDATGYYNSEGGPEPRLFGSMLTGEDGAFEFRSIRPASYPDSRVAQHVHTRVVADGFEERYLEMLFSDDPLASASCAEHGDVFVVANGEEDGIPVVSCVITIRPANP